MLEGEKIRLRALERTDLERCLKWVNDPEVVKFLSIIYQTPYSRAQEEKWLEEAICGKDNRRHFAIETKDGQHIGNISLWIDWVNRSAELGILIGEKDYWDKGYGTDAVKTLLRFAFEVFNLHRVYLKVLEFNTRAIRCYEKCGFQIEGRTRKDHFLNGRYWDTVWMSILQDEWNGNEKLIFR